MVPFVLHNNVCAATRTFPPGYGDDDPGAHDVTVWDTQFGPATDTRIYYQTDQPPVPPTPPPTATPTATPTPKPHPTPSPTAPPAPSMPSGGQSSGGTGGSGGSTGGDTAAGGTNVGGVTNGSGHAATLAATPTAATQSSGSPWVLFVAGIAVLACVGGLLASRRLAR